MNERILTSKLSKFLRTNPNRIQHSFAVEIKLIRGGTLNLNNHVRPQQLPALIKVKHSSLWHKISDFSCSAGASNPFDGVYLYNCPAYLAICFLPSNPKLITRRPKILHFVSINTILSLQLHSPKINEATAKQYAEFSIQL